MTFEDLLQGLHAVVALKMGWAGFEPANSEESGFTVHRNWPTMRPALYKNDFFRIISHLSKINCCQLTTSYYYRCQL